MADSYGLSFTAPPDDRVIIDSEFFRLMVIHKGRYTGTEESGNSSMTYFPTPFTTQEQPLIFIRPDSAAGNIGMANIEVYGSPGNWTGFRIRIFNNYTIKPVGRWFAGIFGSAPVAEFGARIWGAGKKLVFDSGTPAALFVRATNNWAYTGSGQTGQGQTITYFQAPFTMAEEEYVLINNMGVGVNTVGIENNRQISFIWDYPNRTITVAAIGISGYNATFIGITILVARMTS
ncbi:hypothetical protein [Pseudomonas sp. MWU13-2517]|uniref:hypothetical protein n=1 Tax=Pseudomonas sp. MWU13-2517 TaxID=2929055 RepID=UPI00200F690C|nr:hypothetical protein [Pseudomonas sp. MWU13-2517]